MSSYSYAQGSIVLDLILFDLDFSFLHQVSLGSWRLRGFTMSLGDTLATRSLA